MTACFHHNREPYPAYQRMQDGYNSDDTPRYISVPNPMSKGCMSWACPPDSTPEPVRAGWAHECASCRWEPDAAKRWRRQQEAERLIMSGVLAS